jgi:hypothetical protein
MAFDVDGARKAGYSDTEIADHLAKDSGFDTAGARKSGYTDAELITHLRPKVETFAAKPTAEQELLASKPMRFAKGMKDPIDGLAQIAQLSTEYSPVSMISKALGGPSVSDLVNKAADKIGGAGTFLGDVVGIKGANQEQLRADIKDSSAEYEAARKATGNTGFDFVRTAGNIASPANVLAIKAAPVAKVGAPMRQVAARSAVGGAAGAAMQPVTGENFLAEKAVQTATGAGAGAVLGPAVAKIGESAGRFVDRWRNTRNTVNVTPERLREMVRTQLDADGIDTTTIPDHVFEGLTNNVRQSLATGRKLDPAAALRQADFDALQIPAMQGQVTRNPAQWQREFNLSGVEGVGEPLQAVQQAQSRGIATRMRPAGAMERYDAGNLLGDQLRAANQTAEDNVRAAYQAFRQSTGKDLDVPLQGLAQDYARTVETFGDAIPASVRKQFEGLGLMGGTQRQTFGIEQAEQLIKTINANYDPANKVQARALNDLRQGLQRSITDAADSSSAGAEAAHLATEARQMAAGRFRTLDQTPALRAAVNDAQPDDFVQRYVINGKVNEIQSMQSLLGPEGRGQIRDQTLAYLQQKAFGANAAGDGKAAQATFNNELQKIGRPKLVALLGEDGANEMFRVGRVLAYIKQAPEGATPNTSGTGQMLTSMLGKTRGLKGLPFVNEWAVQPLQRFGERREVRQALSGPPAQAAELDPQTIQALTSLFAPLPVAAGVAAGQSRR